MSDHIANPDHFPLSHFSAFSPLYTSAWGCLVYREWWEPTALPLIKAAVFQSENTFCLLAQNKAEFLLCSGVQDTTKVSSVSFHYQRIVQLGG
jgi:hypothetical protein